MRRQWGPVRVKKPPEHGNIDIKKGNNAASAFVVPVVPVVPVTSTVSVVFAPLPSLGDEMFDRAVDAIFETGLARVSILQRRLKLGYSSAARIIDELEELGIIGPFAGSEPRQILLTREQYVERVRSGQLRKSILDKPDEPNTPDKEPDKEQDPMAVIVAMESKFESRYRFCWEHMLNAADCQKMYDYTVGEFDYETLPLMAQVRFEQLCEEYKKKFDVPNPFVMVDAMAGDEFEKWCAMRLRKNGFADVELTKGSGDHGVDVLASKDGIRYAIQCKCYSSNLGNKSVQEVYAGKAMYGCHVGVVMTNRYFTAGARELAKATGVLLWDRDRLESLF